MDEETAKEKAHEKVLWAVKRNFFDNYSAFLWHNAYLEDDDIHIDILSDIAEKVQDKGMNVQKAVNRAVAKHKSKLDRLFQYEDEQGEDESESEEEMAEEAEDSDWSLGSVRGWSMDHANFEKLCYRTLYLKIVK